MPIIQQSQNLPANGVPIFVGLQLETNALMARNSLDAYQRCIELCNDDNDNSYQVTEEMMEQLKQLTDDEIHVRGVSLQTQMEDFKKQIIMQFTNSHIN